MRFSVRLFVSFVVLFVGLTGFSVPVLANSQGDVTMPAEYSCPSTYAYNSSTVSCHKVGEYSDQIAPTYSCSAGYSYSSSNARCEKTVNSVQTHVPSASCQSGYSYQSSSNTCRKNVTLTSSVSQSCPSGQTLQDGNCYTQLSGTQCKTHSSASRSCLATNSTYAILEYDDLYDEENLYEFKWAGQSVGSGQWYDQQVPHVQNGFVYWVGAYDRYGWEDHYYDDWDEYYYESYFYDYYKACRCDKDQLVSNSAAAKSCSAGYSLNSEATQCQKAHTYVQAPNLSCNSGYVLSGNECRKTTTGIQAAARIVNCAASYNYNNATDFCEKPITSEQTTARTGFCSNSDFFYNPSRDLCEYNRPLFSFDNDAPASFKYSMSNLSGLPDFSSSDFVAATKGSLSVSQGIPSYRLGINLPPAVNDLKPDLSLSYSGQDLDGMAGKGWSVSGLLNIRRCRTYLNGEGVLVSGAGPVRYSDDDNLCLNGDLLVLHSGEEYWGEGAEYRLNSDVFTKVQAFGRHNGAHSYFKVWDKNGRIYTFAQEEFGQNSRKFAPGRESGPVNTWAVDKVEDRYSNSYQVHYLRNTSNGESYPNYILFEPGSAVVFNYADRASLIPDAFNDIPAGYDMGYKYKITKILTGVTTYIDVNGGSNPRSATPVKTYEIDHIRSVTTKKYLVDNITLCGFDSIGVKKCAKPVTFEWQQGETGFDRQVPLTTCAGEPVNPKIVRDLDGDGFNDYITENALHWGQSEQCVGPKSGLFSQTPATSNISVQRLSANSALTVIFGTDGFSNIETRYRLVGRNLTFVSSVDMKNSTTSDIFVDTNGDGVDENYQSDSASQQYVHQGGLSGFVHTVLPTSPIFVDYRGSGWLTRIGPKPRETKLRLCFPDEGCSFTGEGVHDVAVGDAQQVDISNNVGGVISLPGGEMYEVLDLNGDGYEDIAYRTRGTWRYHLNTQRGFAAQVDTGIPSGSAKNQFSHAYDYNKDGLQDLVVERYLPNATGYKYALRVLISRINANGEHELIDPDIAPFTGLGSDGGDIRPGAGQRVGINPPQFLTRDLNGDGLVDLHGEGSSKVAYAKTKKPDVLVAVTNGFGAQSKITYSTLSGKSNGRDIYTPSAVKHAYPDKPLDRSQYVVKSIEQSNGMGGFNRADYYYSGGKYNYKRRQSSGFEKVESIDYSDNIVTEQTFLLDYPFTGLVNKTVRKDINGSLINVVKNSYVRHDQNNNFIYENKTTTCAYELTTADENDPLRASVVKREFSVYGNLLSQTTTVGSGISGETVTGIERIHNVTAEYNNNEYDWLIGFKTSETQAFSHAGGVDSRSYSTAFTQQPGTLDSQVVTMYEGSAIEQTASTQRLANGVIESISSLAKNVDGSQTPTRTVRYNQFNDGLYPGEIVNAKNQRATLTYDKRFGSVLNTTDANGLLTANRYNALGLLVHSTQPNGAEAKVATFYCQNNYALNCTTYSVYAVVKTVEHSANQGYFGSPVSITYFDHLEREVRSEVVSLNGQSVKIDTQYDAKGRVLRKSEPFTSNTAQYWTTFYDYDALDRPARIVGPEGGGVTYTYSNEGGELRTVETVNVETSTHTEYQTKTVLKNALDLVTQVLDDHGTPVVYTYNSQGHLETTEVDNNADTLVMLEHDLAGNRTFISDPNAGNIHFDYNGFGELIRQVWEKGTPNQKSISYWFDVLGRQTIRVDDPVVGSDITHTWTWDTKKVGMLSSKQGNGFSEEYFYDSLTRLSAKSASIGGMGTRTFNYTYDMFGRPNTTTYPTGLKIQRQYHAAGLMTRIDDITITTPKMLWAQSDDINSRGTLIKQLFGNGVMSITELDERNGRLKGLVSGMLSETNTENNFAGNVQHLLFDSDSIGNLRQRRSVRQSIDGEQLEYLNEDFGYDGLNRLTSSYTSGLPSSRNRSYQYDNLGNVTYRTDTGSMVYGNASFEGHQAGVNAVTSANGQSYRYDLYGNMVRRGSDILEYNVFNKPTRIGNTYFTYGPNHARFKQVTNGRTTYYVGAGEYEEIVENGTVTQKSYVDGFLLHTKEGSKNTFTYLHKDHIGSIEAMTDATGTTINRMSFDPWGQRQEANWETGNPTLGNPNFFPTSKGFTGHEMLEETKLIHMNGRVYDPLIGRFLTADIFIQAPHNSQSFNRYSYVLNNPLSNIDPSGYYFFSALQGASSSNKEEASKPELKDVLGELEFKKVGENSKQNVYDVERNGRKIERIRVQKGSKGERTIASKVGNNKSNAHSSGSSDSQIQEGSSSLSATNEQATASSLTSQGGSAQKGGAAGDSRSGFWSGVKNVAGKIWNLPNTVIGLGVSTLALGADLIQSTVMTIATGRNHFQNIGLSFGNNAIQIKTGLNLFGSTNGGLTIGNVILYNNSDPSQNIRSPYVGHRTVNLGQHEGWHTLQGERLGIFYLPGMIKNGVANPNNRLEIEADNHSLVR